MTEFQLCESIPTGVNLKTPHHTGQTLIDLVNSATKEIYITAMYWSLLACPPMNGKTPNWVELAKTPIPYDTNCPGDPTFSPDQLKKLGSDEGRQLFQALRDAAVRGVNLNIISGRGFGGISEDVLIQQTVTKMAGKNHGEINLFNINTMDWWGGGIFHQKIWIFDPQELSASIYIGSANMDWKSLTQVKELGIVVKNNKTIANDVLKYWTTWQVLSKTDKKMISKFTNSEFNVPTQTPCWSPYILESTSKLNHCNPPSGFDGSTQYTKEKQLVITNKSSCFITGCPLAMCVSTNSNLSPRTFDEDGIIYTMNNARKSICISVMDFCPSSIYFEGFQVWWSKFTDAVLNAVITRKLDVKILVSKWAYSAHIQEKYLQNLLNTSKTCQIGEKDPNWSGSLGPETNCGGTSSSCFPGPIKCGTLEIKQIELPGWNKTQGTNPEYTSHSRVNHTKYLVTDQRANIGTSNWTWGYFYNTAGSSFNTNDKDVIKGLQDIFNRDWNSNYAYDLGKNLRISGSCAKNLLILILIVLIFFPIIFFTLSMGKKQKRK